MTTIDEVKSLLAEILQLGERRDMLNESTALLGSLPELDSMAVATVIAGIRRAFTSCQRSGIETEAATSALALNGAAMSRP